MPRWGGTTTKTPGFLTCDGLCHALAARDPLLWRRAIRMAWLARTGRRSCVRNDCSPARPVMPHHAPLHRGVRRLATCPCRGAGRPRTASQHASRECEADGSESRTCGVGPAIPAAASARNLRLRDLGGAAPIQPALQSDRSRAAKRCSSASAPTNPGTRRAIAPTPPGRRPTAYQSARPIVASIRPWGSSVGRNTVPGFSSPKGFRSIGT